MLTPNMVNDTTSHAPSPYFAAHIIRNTSPTIEAIAPSKCEKPLTGSFTFFILSTLPSLFVSL